MTNTNHTPTADVHALYWTAIAADDAYGDALRQHYTAKLAPLMRYRPADQPAYIQRLGNTAHAAQDAYITAVRSR